MSSTKNAPPEPMGLRGIRLRLAVALGIAAVLLTSYLYAPWSTTGPVLCPHRYVTGLDCPGCGMTRSFCALAHGQVFDAFAHHVLGPVFFLGLTLLAPLLVIEAIRRRPLPGVHRVLFSKRLAYVLATILVINWGYHMATQYADGRLSHSVRTSVMGRTGRVLMSPFSRSVETNSAVGDPSL